DVLLALHEGAAAVDAVELDPNLVDLVRDTYADFSGRLYARPEVTVHTAEARGFVAASQERYDLIQLPLLDSFAAAGAGNVSLHESFVYTVEAFADYLAHLEPGGYLAVTRWLKLPPRDSLKLFLTALLALEEAGAREPERQIALLRSWDTTLLLVRNGALTEGDLGRIREFAEARSFDLAYLPGLRADEANRFNVLDQPYFYQGAQALSGPHRQEFLDHGRSSSTNTSSAWRQRPTSARISSTSSSGRRCPSCGAWHSPPAPACSTGAI
ncbi:MAG: SAM-dependent methyltransferase, partial [Geminicoccaceae bacterium]|nr:SAM-dependent methyltransferase [Geminicoccaceae bacterium]